jgi:serine/threonine protein phosphatase 1
MLKTILRSARKQPAAAGKNERIYAIGDIHGRADLLRWLLDEIGDHVAAQTVPASTYVVVIGDLIDRGPESAEVLRLLQNAQSHTDRLVVLLGNHEQLMLRALEGDRQTFSTWMRVGGIQTLESFGLDSSILEVPFERAIADIRAAVPREILEWLNSLPLTARSGDYLFCHAGVRPGVPINRQDREDLLWIRHEFLNDESDHGAVVVHGHSISSDVQVRSNRIGIDTGAYRTGVLTAVYLERTDRKIISVSNAAGVCVRDLLPIEG